MATHKDKVDVQALLGKLKWWELKGTTRKGGPATRGYVSVKRHPYRDWLLHRAVADVLVREWNPHGWDSLPPTVEVHHQDHDRANCQPWNLIILDPRLHHAFQEAAPRCPYTGRYMVKERKEGMGSHSPLSDTDREYLRELAGLT